MDDRDSKMDPSMCFTGSGVFPYKPTEHLEAGIGRSSFHSITAMQHYRHSSVEEIRMEDYRASGGFFGSAFAKLSGALCVHPSKKPTPYRIGELYREAINPFIQELVENDIRNERNHLIKPQSVVPVIVFKTESLVQKPNLNLSFHGEQNVNIVLKSDLDLNLAIHCSPQKLSSPSAKKWDASEQRLEHRSRHHEKKDHRN